MIKIHPYQKAKQKDIDALLNEIAGEFERPISNPDNSTRKVMDGYWVAYYETEVVGTVGVLKIDNQTAILKSMFVKKKYRGKDFGVSNLLLKKIFDWCQTGNISCIYLGTMSQFKAAHKFYEKHGFQKIIANELPSNFIANPIDDVFYKIKLKPNP